MGVDGEGTLGRAVEGRRELEEGAGGAEKGEEPHQQGCVHQVFAKVIPLGEESQDQQNGAKIGWDESGFMNGPRQKKSPKADAYIKKGKNNRNFWHREY